LELSGDALFIHDDRGRIYDRNSETCRSLSYLREELLSMRIGDFVSDMIPKVERETKKGGTVWQRVMSKQPGRIVGVHVGEFRREDGTTIPVEVSVAPLSTAVGVGSGAAPATSRCAAGSRSASCTRPSTTP